MKKKILILLVFLFFGFSAFAENWDSLYDAAEPFQSKLYNDIDPYQDEDTIRYSWSPYPLFRLTGPLFFKTITIEPGYYLLTPREHEGKWYMLFKVQGKIKYIIPVYERDITPEFFYDENLPKPQLTWSQKVHINFLDFVGKHFQNSKRKPAPQTYLEATDLDNNFLSLVVYWGAHRYYMIFRTVGL